MTAPSRDDLRGRATPDGPSRARSRRASSPRLAAVLGLLALAGACRELAPASPRAPRGVRLSLIASTDAVADGRQVDVRVFYRRTSNQRITLHTQSFEVDTGTRALDLTVDLTPCLRDPDRDGGRGCPLSATLVLRDPRDGAVDSTTVGPVDVSGTSDQVVTLPAASLVRTASMRPVAATVRVHGGDTISVLAQALDAAGRVLARQPTTWSSADPSVATVTRSGLVSAIRTGATTLTAEREGQTTSVRLVVPARGVDRWVVGERLSTVGRGDPVYGIVTGVTTREDDAVAFSAFGSQSCRLGGGSWACGTTGFSGWGYYALGPSNAWLAGTGRVAKYEDGQLRILPTGGNSSYNGVWGNQTAVVAVGAAGAIAQYDGTRWTLTEPRAGAGGLHGVWGSSPTNVFVTGDSGTVLHWNGQAWSRTQLRRPDPLARLDAVWGADSTHVFAAGTWGMAWMHDGRAWTEMPSANSWNVAGIHGTSASDVYLVGQVDSNHVLQRWDGTRWSRLANLPTVATGVYADGRGRVFVTGYDGYVGVYQGGQLTTLALSPDFTAVDATARTHAVVGSRVAFHRFDGTRWQSMPRPWGAASKVGWLYDVKSTGPNETFATFYMTREFVARFDGTSWARIGAHPSWGYGSLTVLGAGDALVAARRWDGTQWFSQVHRCSATACVPQTPELTGHVHSIWASSPTNVFVVGQIPGDAAGARPTTFHAMRWDGRTWTRRDFPSTAVPNAVWGLDSARVLVSAGGTTGAGVLRYDYATGAWQQMPGSTSTGRVWGTEVDDLHAAGCGISRWYNGRWWRSLTTGAPNCMLAMDGLESGGAIATAEASLVLHGIAPDGAFAPASGALRRLLGDVGSRAWLPSVAPSAPPARLQPVRRDAANAPFMHPTP